MKRFIGAALALAIALLLLPAFAFAIGETPAKMHAKSPLRYVSHSFPFSGTSSTTGNVIGVCPLGGAVLKDVIVSQAGAGVAGHHWTATPKKNGTALVSTAGGFTLAASTNKTANTAKAPIVLTLPTGGTRAVIDAAQAKCSGGDVITTDVTLTGTYASATATLSSAVATNKVTIASHDFTAVASGATGDQWNIGADDNASAANLAAAINASTTSGVQGVVTASASGAVVTVTAVGGGTGGNAITFTKTGSPITVTGGGTLAGATDYSTGPTGIVTLRWEPNF